MQVALKVSFWISTTLAVMGYFLLGTPRDSACWYLVVSLFALPGVLIRTRFYKLATTTILGMALIVIVWGFSENG